MKGKNHIALIIDDEEDIGFLLGNLLRQHNYIVKVAHSLNAGLAMLIQFNPDLLFLDLNLPDGSGLEFIRPIKEHFPQTHVIVISAYEDIDRKIAENEGADVYINKPLTQENIMQSILKVNV